MSVIMIMTVNHEDFGRAPREVGQTDPREIEPRFIPALSLRVSSTGHLRI